MSIGWRPFDGLVMCSSIGQDGVDPLVAEELLDTGDLAVLMDIRMPGMDEVEAPRRLCEHWSETKVIILTTFDEDANIIEGLRAGAVGYLLKDLSGEELAQAVRTVYHGRALIEPTVAKRVLAEIAYLHPPTRTMDEGLPEPLSA